MFVRVILAAILSYALSIVLARSLSLTDFGLFFAVFSLIRLSQFFRDFGLTTALTKYLVEFRINKNFNAIQTAILSTLSLQLFFSLIIGIAFFLFSDYLAIHYFKNSGAAILLKLFIFYIFLSVFFKIETSILKAFHKFRLLAFLEPTRLLIVLISVLFLIPLGYLAPLFAYILGWGIAFLIFLPFVLKLVNIRPFSIAQPKQISKKLLSFGLPVLFTGFGARIVGRLDTLMLAYFASIEKVGIYNAILPSALIFTFFASAITPILFPLVVEFWQKKELTTMNEGIGLIHKYLFILIIPFILLLFAFSAFLPIYRVMVRCG